MVNKIKLILEQLKGMNFHAKASYRAIVQQYYRNSVIGFHVRGYIKPLSHNPFIVHLYTEDQIKILKLFKDTRIVLHLDATGSIVRK